MDGRVCNDKVEPVVAGVLETGLGALSVETIENSLKKVSRGVGLGKGHNMDIAGEQACRHNLNTSTQFKLHVHQLSSISASFVISEASSKDTILNLDGTSSFLSVSRMFLIHVLELLHGQAF